MKYKDFKYVIITDKDNRPMSYSKADGQICYCDDDGYIDEVHPIVVVSKQVAKNQIKRTIKYRKFLGMTDSETEYKLMPVREKK